MNLQESHIITLIGAGLFLAMVWYITKQKPIVSQTRENFEESRSISVTSTTSASSSSSSAPPFKAAIAVPVIDENGSILRIAMIDPGQGYLFPPRVKALSLYDPNLEYIEGHDFVGRAILENGSVSRVEVLNSGFDYGDNCQIQFVPVRPKPPRDKADVDADMEKRRLEERLAIHERLIQKLLTHQHPDGSTTSKPSSALPVITYDKPKPRPKYKPLITATREESAMDRALSQKADQRQDLEFIRSLKQYQEELRLRDDMRDFARGARVYQSTTEFDATRATDGDRNTFSSTDYRDGSWWEAELSETIELHAVYFHFRLWQTQELAFEVVCKNANGIQVFRETYTIDRGGIQFKKDYPGDTVIRTLRIRVIEPQVSKLALSDVRIIGRNARSCMEYKRDFNRTKEDNIERIIASQYSNVRSAEQKRLARLYETCIDMNVATEEMAESVVREQAAKYREMMAQQNQVLQQEADAAKQELIAISKQILKEEEIAQEAKELGIQPPPPMYTPDYVQSLRKRAEYVDTSKGMRDTHASECMILYNKYMTLKRQAEDLGQRSSDDPTLVDQAKSKGMEANEVYNLYKFRCQGECGGMYGRRIQLREEAKEARKRYKETGDRELLKQAKAKEEEADALEETYNGTCIPQMERESAVNESGTEGERMSD